MRESGSVVSEDAVDSDSVGPDLSNSSVSERKPRIALGCFHVGLKQTSTTTAVTAEPVVGQGGNRSQGAWGRDAMAT